MLERLLATSPESENVHLIFLSMSSPPSSMDLVYITLLDFKLGFRKLTYQEEFALSYTAEGDQTLVYLAAALDEVCLPGRAAYRPDRDAATLLIARLPTPVRRKVWVEYRAGVPANRFFSTNHLYLAPSVDDHYLKVWAESIERDDAHDPAVGALGRKSGQMEVNEQMAVQQAIFEDAKRRGVLTRSREVTNA